MFFNLKEKKGKHKREIQAIEDENLNNYLKDFNCNNCHNHCSLDKIKCGRGLESRDKACEDYLESNKNL